MEASLTELSTRNETEVRDERAYYDKRDSSLREGGSKPAKVVEAKALVACSVPSASPVCVVACFIFLESICGWCEV